MKNELISGNVALAEAAIRCGCRHYFGYPITPQTGILEHMARRLPEVDGVFIQVESELAAIYMVYGAAAAGRRVMTASSGPGMSLMQEGISYLASAELPCVLVNVMRTGPGLGTILPSQGDYWQSTRGGGHGDYHLLVLAPSSVQEMADLTGLAFNLAEKYMNPVMILTDGALGEMMEGAILPSMQPESVPGWWAVTGAEGRPRRTVVSSPVGDPGLRALNSRLQKKYRDMEAQEIRWEGYYLDDAEVIMVAFGSAARVALEAVERAREQGVAAGLFRPISLWPFPYNELLRVVSERPRKMMVVEMNAGQMFDDVRLAVARADVHFYGQPGGDIPAPEVVLEKLMQIYEGL